jgi:hypothetical protein
MNQPNIQRLESLIQQAEILTDDEARKCSIELLEALMELHGACLERLMEIVSQHGAAGQEIRQKLAADEAVSALLLLYGLHPWELKQRLDRALHQLSEQLHGTTIELVSLDDGVVRLRLTTNGHGCQTAQLRTAIHEAIVEVAPDIVDLIIEEVVPEREPVFVTLQRRQPAKVAMGS